MRENITFLESCKLCGGGIRRGSTDLCDRVVGEARSPTMCRGSGKRCLESAVGGKGMPLPASGEHLRDILKGCLPLYLATKGLAISVFPPVDENWSDEPLMSSSK